MKQDYKVLEDLYGRFVVSCGSERYREPFRAMAECFIEQYWCDWPERVARIQKWIHISQERGWL